MRTRSWRRYKEEVRVIKRLKYNNQSSRWYRYRDANKNLIQDYLWLDSIGTDSHFCYKTMTTPSESFKMKYGKKGRKRRGYYGSDSKNRIYDKKMFRKMLETDYGIKHFNLSYGFMENHTE